VIANGCALERFLPQPKQELILAAGRLWDEAKNLGALDAAAARLSWPVHVAGETRHPERGAVAPRHAHTLGPLAAEALAEWMGRAAIYALPARYEPFGLSVLEAAAAGCALVLGDIPSLREIWGAAAEFVPPDDIEALAGALDGLIADDARRQRLGALAQRRAQAFSAERMAQSYAALYAELLTRRSSGAARFLVSAG
jgi:glycogen(starch) synthase